MKIILSILLCVCISTKIFASDGIVTVKQNGTYQVGSSKKVNKQIPIKPIFKV